MTPRAVATDQGLEFWYTRELPSAAAPSLKTPLPRRDLVLVGETVSITKEIKTDGGHVLILADRLVVNAPIDTRVHSIPIRIWEQGSPLALSDFRYAPEAVAPFINVYLWHDYYDPNSHTYKYRAGSLADFQEGKIALPIMPFGLIPTAQPALPPWEGTPLDGPNAPSGYDRNIFKSGNITIYARVIEFCETCIRRSFEGQAVPEGDPGDREYVRFFNAAGLKGGRAGLGSLFPCPYRAQYHISPTLICDQHGVPDRSGGLSGHPGQGGDAGDVRIFIVNNPGFVRDQNSNMVELASSSGGELNEKLGRSIAALTDIKSGRPSHPSRLRTPSFNALTSSQSRRLFTPEGPSVEPPGLYGADGKVVIENMSAEVALQQFAAAVTAIDADPKYDLSELVHRQYESQGSARLIARDWLAEFLSDLLRSRQVDLLQRLIDTPQMIKGGSAQGFRQDFLSDLNCVNGSIHGLSDLELEIIREICAFRPTLLPQDALRSYFAQTHGLFRPSVIIAMPNPQLKALTDEVSHVKQTLLKLISELQDLKSMFYDFVTNEIKIRYETRINELKTSLSNVMAVLEAQKDWLAQVAAIGKDAQSHLQDAATEWAKPAPNFFAVAGSTGALIDNMTKLFKLMDSVYHGTLTREQEVTVRRIQAELSSVEKEFGRFLEETAAMKKKLLKGHLQSLREYLDAKERGETSRRLFMFDFENYLRAALLLYAADPSQRDSVIVTALRSLKDALINFPDQSLTSLPSLPDTGCTEEPMPFTSIPPKNPLACASVNAEETDYALVSTSASRLPNFPLLSVAAGSGTYTVNFHRIFTPSEIHKVDTARITELVKGGSGTPSILVVRLPSHRSGNRLQNDGELRLQNAAEGQRWLSTFGGVVGASAHDESGGELLLVKKVTDVNPNNPDTTDQFIHDGDYIKLRAHGKDPERWFAIQQCPEGVIVRLIPDEAAASKLFLQKATPRNSAYPDTLDNIIRDGDYVIIRGEAPPNPWFRVDGNQLTAGVPRCTPLRYY
jgi:hypothetical protein